MEQHDTITRKEVIKHSSAVQIENSISLLQRRSWNVLLACAYDSLPEKEIHEVKVSTLMQALNFDSKNDQYLKEALEAIVGCRVKWNILDKDRKHSWGVTTLLAHVEIKEGTCFYSYSAPMRSKLYNPNMYARISLSMQNRFSSKYTLAVYELCVDYMNFTTGKGETPSITLEAFRTLMGLGEDEYPEFKKLNQKVIKPSLDEINSVSDLSVSIRFSKANRKVASLKYVIKRKKPHLPLAEAIQKPLLLLEDKSPLSLEQRLQQDFCLSSSQAQEVITQYPESYITEILNLIEQDYKAGKISKIAPYTMKALKEDFREKRSAFDLAKEKADAVRQVKALEAAKSRENYQHILDEFEKFQSRKVEEYLSVMTEQERLNLFENFLQEKISNDPVFRAVLTRGGKENPIVESVFHSYLAQEHLPGENNDLFRFAHSIGFEIKGEGEAIPIS